MHAGLLGLLITKICTEVCYNFFLFFFSFFFPFFLSFFFFLANFYLENSHVSKPYAYPCINLFNRIRVPGKLSRSRTARLSVCRTHTHTHTHAQKRSYVVFISYDGGYRVQHRRPFRRVTPSASRGETPFRPESAVKVESKMNGREIGRKDRLLKIRLSVEWRDQVFNPTDKQLVRSTSLSRLKHFFIERSFDDVPLNIAIFPQFQVLKSVLEYQLPLIYELIIIIIIINPSLSLLSNFNRLVPRYGPRTSWG